MGFPATEAGRKLQTWVRLLVFDNSAEASIGEDIPQPMLVLEMKGGRLKCPDPADAAALVRTPEWARAVVQAALELG